LAEPSSLYAKFAPRYEIFVDSAIVKPTDVGFTFRRFCDFRSLLTISTALSTATSAFRHSRADLHGRCQEMRPHLANQVHPLPTPHQPRVHDRLVTVQPLLHQAKLSETESNVEDSDFHVFKSVALELPQKLLAERT
jgi:hypothetical protein